MNHTPPYIFKDIPEDQINESVVETEEIYGWIQPGLREEKDRLSDFGLRPYRPRFTSLEAQEPPPQFDRLPASYFYKVYDRTDRNGIQLFDEAKLAQFTVAYGNKEGKGGQDATVESGGTEKQIQPTQAIYEQYAGSLLPKGQETFGFPRDHFYSINLNRRVFEKRVAIGKWSLTLAFEGTGADNGVILTDRSAVDSQTDYSGREEIEIVPVDEQGNLLVPPDRPGGTGGDDEISSMTYGYFYPGKGIIILNPDALSFQAEKIGQTPQSSTGLVSPKGLHNITPETRPFDDVVQAQKATDESGNELSYQDAPLEVQKTFPDGSDDEDDGIQIYKHQFGFDGNLSAAEDTFPNSPEVQNQRKIFDAIKRGQSFRMQAEKDVIKLSYTVSATQEEFNYSMNPTYSSESGSITFDDAPGAYPSAIGLYNDDFELIATAKLSPLRQKDPASGFSVDVNLSF